MPRREREQDPPVDACCGPRLKRVPLDNSLEKSRPTPVPSELTRAVRGASVHDGLGRLKLLTPHATHDLRLEPVERDYMVGWQLGKGSFGTVFVALSRANRRDVRAVKVIDLGHADARTISKLAVDAKRSPGPRPDMSYGLRLRMSSGALPGPDLLRVIPRAS